MFKVVVIERHRSSNLAKRHILLIQGRVPIPISENPFNDSNFRISLVILVTSQEQ